MSIYSVNSEDDGTDEQSAARSFELMEMARRSVVTSSAANLNQTVGSLDANNVNDRKTNERRKDRAKKRGRRHSFTLSVDEKDPAIAAAQLMAMQQASREMAARRNSTSDDNKSNSNNNSNNKSQGSNESNGSSNGSSTDPPAPLTEAQLAVQKNAVEAAMLRAKQLAGVEKSSNAKTRRKMRRARRSTMNAISDDGTVDMAAIRAARINMINETKERRSSMSSDGDGKSSDQGGDKGGKLERLTTETKNDGDENDENDENDIDAAAAAAVAAMNGINIVGGKTPSSLRSKRCLKSNKSIAHGVNKNKSDDMVVRKRTTLRRNDSIAAKLSRRMSKVVMPRVRYLFNPNAANTANADMLNNRKNSGTCVIHGQSTFRVCWDLALFALLMYISFVTPVRIGFEQHPDQYTSWWWFEIVIDITFVIDLTLNFRTTFYRSDGKEVTKGNEIAWNYFKSWFWIDFLSSIPFDLIVGAALGVTDDSDSLQNIQASKTLKISKSARISKLSKITKVLKLTKLARLARASRLITRYADMFYVSRNQMKLVKLFFVTMAMAHIIACGWGLVAHLDDNMHVNTWLSESGMVDESGMEQYLTAFYWSVTTMITVGYGDVHPVNSAERLYSIFAIIFGGGYYGYIIASVASLVASWDINRKTYYERMDSVTTYMKVRKFPRPLYRKMRSYFRHFYAKKTSVDEHSILASLSTALRREVISFLVSDIRGKILKGIPMFTNLDGAQLAQLLTILRPLQAEEGQNIVTAGEKGMEMFILMSGQLCVQSSEGEVFAHLDPGACFGELAALGLKEERSATIVATEFSELYSLTRTDIFETFMNTPEVLDTMVLIAAKNLQNYRDDDDNSDEDEDENEDENDDEEEKKKKKKQTTNNESMESGSSSSNSESTSDIGSSTRLSSGDSPNSTQSFGAGSPTAAAHAALAAATATATATATVTSLQKTNTGSPLTSKATAVAVARKRRSSSKVALMLGGAMGAEAAKKMVEHTEANHGTAVLSKQVETITEEDEHKAENAAKKAMESMARLHNKHAPGFNVSGNSGLPLRSGLLSEDNESAFHEHRLEQRKNNQALIDRMDSMSMKMEKKLAAIMTIIGDQFNGGEGNDGGGNGGGGNGGGSGGGRRSSSSIGGDGGGASAKTPIKQQDKSKRRSPIDNGTRRPR
jgi:hypothetical protein